MRIGIFAIILVVLTLAGTSLFFIYNQVILNKNINILDDNTQIENKNEKKTDDSIPKGDVSIKKQVKVDLSSQKMYLFQEGKEMAKYDISSGLAESPTPKGKYKIVYKQEKVYSKIAGCWLSYWAGFTLDGLYGFHETPVCNKIRQGEENIGQPASHGCIRLKIGQAEAFYNWVEINTPIEIL
jgi:lipoprotein-anchoring transpeptidase ErfK/SrfK